MKLVRIILNIDITTVPGGLMPFSSYTTTP